MPNIYDLDSEGSPTIQVDAAEETLRIRSTATEGTPLTLVHSTVLSSPTVAPVQIIVSTASGAFFDFRGAVASTASLNMAASQLAGMVKVVINGAGGYNVGYLPILKGVA